jgi:uroporphyrin-III C-methyltransferase
MTEDVHGVVYLVGAGPGAPDLLTLRAARLLGEADVVFHDALVHPEVLALAPDAEKIAVGKRCGAHSTAQRFINKRLVDAARRHRVVVRVKGGDPMLFGRAQEEIDALAAANIRYEVVPGVTSALAASAHIGASLTRRGVARSVAFVTPRVGDDESASDWTAAAVAADSVALYMGAGQAEAIRDALVARGRSPATPVVVVRNASLPDASTCRGTLAELPALCATGDPAALSQPAMILLGDTFAAERIGAQSTSDDGSDTHAPLRRYA